MTSITIYDGAQGIGGNKILVGGEKGNIFLDFGKNFGKYGVFYEEFLRNRDSRGTHDLVHLDLIPKLNIYRADLVPADLLISSYPSPEITAVLVSHAHVDHTGNIGLLDLGIPIVASPLTLAIMKGFQDSGTSSAETDAFYASPKMPISENVVYDTCRAACDGARGLIIADFSPRNFERLETFTRIASETGRMLVVTARDLYLLDAMQCADGVCRYKSVGVYGELVNMAKRKWETEVVMDRAYDQYISHGELHDDPDGYILCFSFYDMKHLLDIKPDKGTYIYSSCEAFNEEMEIDFRRLWQWTRRFGLEVRGFSLDGNGKPVFDSRYHASGHASREDLAWVIDQVDPDILIPVYTDNHQWFFDTFENVPVMQDGERLGI